MISAAQFAAQAIEWVGVPWRHQGRTRLGTDCVGVTIGVLAELGVEVRARANYGRLPMQDLVDEVARLCAPAPGPAIGVLVTLRWPAIALPGHLAILVPPPSTISVGASLYMVHAYLATKRVVVNSFSDPWPGRVVGYWRAPGVSY